jgi:hypothetical protein
VKIRGAATASAPRPGRLAWKSLDRQGLGALLSAPASKWAVLTGTRACANYLAHHLGSTSWFGLKYQDWAVAAQYQWRSSGRPSALKNEPGGY